MKASSFVTSLMKSVCLFWLASLPSFAFAQDAAGKPTSATALMRDMSGTWEVQARMWPGAKAKAVELPSAVARRELLQDAYLQETMQPGKNSEGPSFTRVAYLNYNLLNQQYEYFSLDSRLPQMMSYVLPGANKDRDGKIDLVGMSFVAPEWGPDKNVPFMYRLAIGPVEGNKQVVQLFLTKQNGEDKEFLAFEYVYRRQR